MRLYITYDYELDAVTITRFLPCGAYLTDVEDVVKGISNGTSEIRSFSSVDLQGALNWLCDGEAMAEAGITDEDQSAVEYLHGVIDQYVMESELAELENCEVPEYE